MHSLPPNRAEMFSVHFINYIQMWHGVQILQYMFSTLPVSKDRLLNKILKFPFLFVFLKVLFML